MGLIDDWYGTSPSDRKTLEESCRWLGCTHARYIHGTTRIVRGLWKWIEYEAGKCSGCRCVAFQPEAAITTDEILDVTEAFAGVTHLSDFGLAVLCAKAITRWVGGEATIDMPCGLKPGHDGAHEVTE